MSQKKPAHHSSNTQPFAKTSGRLPYTLTNDYLFRAVFQSCPKALEGLCRAVLHLSPEDEVSITLRNPIELGSHITDKEFILDLALLVNDSLYLNLEMQMYRDAFWTERSLSYVCRGFGNLNRGEDYDRVFPAVHTGFLDYDLFPEHPEFVSTFLLTNTKNGQIFSDRLRISVVYLNRIELATEEDRSCGLDLWAQALKAATWEELEMLSKQNEYLQKTVVTIRKLTAEERIRQQCQAREDFEYWERMRALELKRSKEALAESQRSLREKDAQLAAALVRIAELETEKGK